VVDTHVKVLAVLYIAFGALGTLAAFAVMAVFGIAGVAGAAGMGSDPDAMVALPIIGIAGTALAVFLLVLSLPGVVAGIGLFTYRPWARILTIVLSVLNLMNIPFGTVLGVYGLWVMLSEEGAKLFATPGESMVETVR
jgi:hypothetical protein